MSEETKSAESYQENLYESFEIIANNIVDNAGFDRTISATVVECVDALSARYKVKYQDALMYAYALSTDISYSKGNVVEVKIPNNDMTANKTILGLTERTGANLVPPTSDEDSFNKTNDNCIDLCDTFGLHSYHIEKNDIIELYDAKNGCHEGFQLNLTDVDIYLKGTEHFLMGATIKTALNQEQRFNGDYGMRFTMVFLDSYDREYMQTYELGIDNMSGNPYNFSTATKQTRIFSMAASFQRIERIELFAEGFPNANADEPADIFISDMELFSAEPINESDLSNYALSFTTVDGTYFDNIPGDPDVRSIKADFKIQNTLADTDGTKYKYYWFTEQVGITSQSENYCSYGGAGWRCLNVNNVIKDAVYDDDGNQTEAAVREWVPESNMWYVQRGDVQSSSLTYKCVVLYDETNAATISNTITFLNLNSKYNITIESDTGTEFTTGAGTPTLTCNVENVSPSDSDPSLYYVWSEVQESGLTVVLEDTVDLNDEYNFAVSELNRLQKEIEDGDTTAEKAANEMSTHQGTISSYNLVRRIEQSKVHKIQMAQVMETVTYKCSVFTSEDVFIGTSTIILITRGGVGFRVVIENGYQTFLYNEQGISPASISNDVQQTIYPLGYKVYDENNEDITELVRQKAKRISWVVPITDTMIEVPYEDGHDPDYYDINQEFERYTNKPDLTFNIATTYSHKASRNYIGLEVEYENNLIVGQTNFTFVKQGEDGTNGTELVCRIRMASPVNGYSMDDTPIYKEGVGPVNFNLNGNNPFKVYVWRNGEEIFNGHESKGDVNVFWSVPTNKGDTTFIDEDNMSQGNIKFKDANIAFDEKSHPCNIIQVRVSVDGEIVYSTKPIITYTTIEDYDLGLDENSGFTSVVYNSAGQLPQYDGDEPFRIKTYLNEGGVVSDVSTLSNSYKVDYAWSQRGGYTNKAWFDTNRFTLSSKDSDSRNEKWAIPISTFDGSSQNNAIVSTVTKNGSVIGYIHIPVAFAYNRYEFSHINDWDGTSIEINEAGGYILSPQVGAGVKNANNTFTGVVMGETINGDGSQDVGLFGYGDGVRTFHMDAETGATSIGSEGKGQIILDPSDNEAIIKSGNYPIDPTTGKAAGMEINLSESTITYGTGNFSVDKNGYIVAKGGGSIAGWSIDDDKIHNNSGTGMSSGNVSHSYYSLDNVNGAVSNLSTPKSTAFYAGGTDSTGSSATFKVSHDGDVSMRTAQIGSTASNSLYIGGINGQSSIYSNNKTFLGDTSSGLYLGTDGLAIGSGSTASGGITSAFLVDSSTGTAHMEKAYIGSSSYPDNRWTLGGSASLSYIYHLKTKLDDDTAGVYLGTNGIALGGTSNDSTTANFKVTKSGVMYADSGTIGGWSISGTTLSTGSTNDGITIASGTSGAYIQANNANWYIKGDGSASFSSVIIDGTKVDQSKNSFTNVTVSGSTVSGSTVSGSTLSGTTNNTGTLSGGTVSGATLDNCGLSDYAYEDTDIVFGDIYYGTTPCSTQTINSVKSITVSAYSTQVAGLSSSNVDNYALNKVFIELSFDRYYVPGVLYTDVAHLGTSAAADTDGYDSGTSSTFYR